jgi:hypothetical protein
LLFFLIIRGCMSTNELQTDAGSLKAASLAFGGLAWQTQTITNLTMPAAKVSCPATAVSLISDKGAVSMDRIPVFLPPEVGGRLRVVIKEITLSRTNTPAVPLGSALYGIDDNTYYYLLSDSGASAAGRVSAILNSPNVRTRQSGQLSLERLPRTAKSIVLVRFDDLPFPTGISWPAGAKVYGVRLKVPSGGIGVVTFLELHSNTWDQAGPLREYAGDYLMAGAVVAAQSGTYECAKNALAVRMRYLTRIYQLRSQHLFGLGPVELSNSCKDIHGQIAGRVPGPGNLTPINNVSLTPDDVYLQSLLGMQSTSVGPRLLEAQDNLYIMGCPVIA